MRVTVGRVSRDVGSDDVASDCVLMDSRVGRWHVVVWMGCGLVNETDINMQLFAAACL